MSKVLQLSFDLDDLTPRKTANQETIEKEFFDLFNSFISVVENSFKDAQGIIKGIPPLQRGRNAFSDLLNGLVCGRMYDLYPEKIGRHKYGRMGCIINGTVAYFKKFDERHRPNHAVTKNSYALEKNLQHKCCKENSVIWMGWTLSGDKNFLTGVYANHFSNGYRIWEIDLYEFTNANKVNKIAATPIEGVMPKLKKAKEKKNKNST